MEITATRSPHFEWNPPAMWPAEGFVAVVAIAIVVWAWRSRKSTGGNPS